MVRGAIQLSNRLRVSALLVSLTVVAFGTSAPELIVAIKATLSGSPGLALGNVVGSNIANIGLVLGITALIGTIYVDKSFYKINWPAMMVFSFAFYYFLSNDSKLDAVEGAVLFLSLLLFIAYSLKHSEGIETDDSMDAFTMISNFKIVIWLIIGGVALYFGAKWLVDGAVVIAQKIGVSEAVISVSVIAVGTSIPELAASVIAVLRKEKAISLGNLIGSNIFNIGSVLGMTAMVKPIVVDDPEILSRDIIWMLVFAGLLLPLTLIFKRYEIKKLEGFLMVLLYGVFIYSVFL